MVERQMCVYTVWFAWKAFIYFCVSSRPVDTGECLGRMIDCARVWARSHLFVKASLIRSGAADKQIIDVAIHTHSYIGIKCITESYNPPNELI